MESVLCVWDIGGMDKTPDSKISADSETEYHYESSVKIKSMVLIRLYGFVLLYIALAVAIPTAFLWWVYNYPHLVLEIVLIVYKIAMMGLFWYLWWRTCEDGIFRVVKSERRRKYLWIVSGVLFAYGYYLFFGFMRDVFGEFGIHPDYL